MTMTWLCLVLVYHYDYDYHYCNHFYFIISITIILAHTLSLLSLWLSLFTIMTIILTIVSPSWSWTMIYSNPRATPHSSSSLYYHVSHEIFRCKWAAKYGTKTITKHSETADSYKLLSLKSLILLSNDISITYKFS